MIIVTTTINPPTTATIKFCEIAKQNNWLFIIVGDLKTPHSAYEDICSKNKYVKYLHPSLQEKLYPDLSKAIGWGTIQRRNIGFVYAYKAGADIIATIDDDNIPYDNWGTNLIVGKQVEIDLYKNRHHNYFDPLSITNQKELWHRGYPLELLETKNYIDLIGTTNIKVLVQADFWDGDPDIDAICRLTKKPLVKFAPFTPFTTFNNAPFNTQNTFLHRSVFPHFSVWPSVGRMDDIWASYYLRQKFNNIVYCSPTVYQERNPQDLVRNLENECIGYRYTKTFVDNSCSLDQDFIPDEVREFIKIYENQFN